MTTLAPGQAPANDSEWSRSVEERLRGLANPRTVRIGSWVLQDNAGALTATRPGDVANALTGLAEPVAFDFGDLSGYVSEKDFADALSRMTGTVIAPGDLSGLVSLNNWAAGLFKLGPVVEAITGTVGDIADLAAWALAIPAGVINGVLSTLNIPGLDLSKITTGLATGMSAWLGAAGAIPAAVTVQGSQLLGSVAASLVSGFLNASTNIPGLDAAKIISGQFAQSMVDITSIAGSIITGTLHSSVVVPASIVAGALTALNIPGLDLSKITTGFGTGIAAWLGAGGALPGATTLATSALTGLATGMGTWLTAAGSIPAAATLQGSQLLGSVAASLVSGFLNPTTNIPGIDLSKITTGLGTGIAAWLGGAGALPGTVSLAGSQLTGSVVTDWNNAVTNVGQIGQAAANAAAGIIGSFNTAATQVQTAFSGVINGLVGGLFGIPAPANQTQAEATVALQNLTTNVVGNAAAVIGVQNQIASQANLLRFVTKFSDYGGGANALNSDWTVSDDATVPGTGAGGGIEVVDGRAVYKVSGSGYSAKIARYDVAPTVTDYQEISWVHTGAFTTGGVVNYARIYCRMNSAATSSFRVTVGPSSVDFDAIVAGSVTSLGNAPDLKQGARYTVKLGNLSNADQISLYENETLLETFTDSVHQAGASYRYAGFGINGDNAGGNGSIGFNLFSVADQLFPPGPPAAASVTTGQATSSGSYVDLTTTTDTVTVDIGSSGMALVAINSYAWNTVMNGNSRVSFAVSGATTIAAGTYLAFMQAVNASGGTMVAHLGGTYLVTGLNPGSNTFKMKYSAGGGTATFGDRRIAVIPL